MRIWVLVFIVVVCPVMGADGAGEPITGAFGQELGSAIKGQANKIASANYGIDVYGFDPVGKLEEFNAYSMAVRQSDGVIVWISASGKVEDDSLCESKIHDISESLQRKYGQAELKKKNSYSISKSGRTIDYECGEGVMYVHYSDDRLLELANKAREQYQRRRLEKSGL